VIAVDTNILVYAHRADSSWHGEAQATVAALAAGPGRWAIPWPCLHEFLAIVTHPRIYAPPTTLARAIDQVEAWLEAPNLMLLAEDGSGYWPELRAVLAPGKIAGPKVHDARIVALCRQHGVAELLSADRDFSRFPGFAARNPLIA
jgi:uncharacterized protein